MEPRETLVRDDDELEFVLERTEPALRSTLRWFGIPHEDGEDLLQQAFVTFLVKRPEIRNPDAWLVGTVRKRCVMYWRKRRRDVVQCVDSAILESVAEKSLLQQEVCDLRSDLERALKRLPERCRDLLRLRYSSGLSPIEAAESLGYQSSGIYKIIDRCLSAFCEQLVSGGFDQSAGHSASADGSGGTSKAKPRYWQGRGD